MEDIKVRKIIELNIYPKNAENDKSGIPNI